MVKKIETWNRTFLILERWYKGYGQVAYIGKEMSMDGERMFHIIWIKDDEVAKRFLAYCSNDREGLDDMECMMAEERFYVVFPYEEGENLFDKLEREDFNIRKKLIIGRNLLNKIILLDMPHYLQWDGLAEDGIFLSSSFDVHFLYQCKDVPNFERYGIKDVYKALEKVFFKLFHQEINWGLSGALADFMAMFREEGWNGYLTLYEQYGKAFRELWDVESIQRASPNNLPFRLWEKGKTAIHKCREIFAVILIIIAVIYSIRTVIHSHSLKEKPDEAYRFSYIGSVEIEPKNEVESEEIP